MKATSMRQNIDLGLQVGLLSLEQSIYWGCLASLSWYWMKRINETAFHLATVWAASIIVLKLVLGISPMSAVFGGLASSVTIALLIEIRAKQRLGDFSRRLNHSSILNQIVPALIILPLYDLVTNHAPVFLPVSSVFRIALLSCGSLLLLALWVLNSRSSTIFIKLGAENRWAVDYWRAQPPKFLWRTGITSLCFCVVFLIPTVSTGVLSGTIFRDVTLAVLISRIFDFSGVRSLMIYCSAYGVIRTTVAMGLGNTSGIVLADVAIIVLIILFYRAKLARTPWETPDVP